MRVRWTMAASVDLEVIAEYLFEETPDNAARLIRELYRTPNTLKNFPERGRIGRKEGTRELILSALPYVFVYEIKGQDIFVVRILHGAQKWPK
jgi:toxin ParE1/3/4